MPASVQALSDASAGISIAMQPGLVDVATRRIEVGRSFVDFDDFWGGATLGASIGPLIASMPAEDVARIEARVRAHLRQDGSGRISYGAFADAIRGRVPG
jgi:hypothetical protein